MRKFLIATAAAASIGAGLATPAFAQDEQGPVRAPFTGPRVEAVLGYDNVQDGSDGVNDGNSGLAYGGGVGYDFQAGGLVAGVEGEITGSTTRARGNNVFAAGDNLRVSAGRDFYVGGRLGFAASPRTLIYAKGGYTNARLNTRYSLGNTVVTDGSDLDGFRVGAGVEYKMSGNTYVKGEYRYSHYGNIEGYDIDADRHQVLAGVGVRF